MTTIKEIEDALYDYAVHATGQKWIFQTSEEAPAFPYGVISLLTIQEVGTPGTTETNVLENDIEQKSESFYRVQYDFLFKGDGAQQAILELTNKINLEQNKRFLKDRGIGYENFSGLQNLTGLDIDKVREQAQTTITCNAVLSAEEVVPFIKTAEIEYVEN